MRAHIQGAMVYMIVLAVIVLLVAVEVLAPDRWVFKQRALAFAIPAILMACVVVAMTLWSWLDGLWF